MIGRPIGPGGRFPLDDESFFIKIKERGKSKRKQRKIDIFGGQISSAICLK